MSFTAKMKEAEGHLSSYEGVADEIVEAAKSGLDKLKSHRDAILKSIESAGATAEKFAASIVTDAPAAVPALPAPEEKADEPDEPVKAPSSLMARLPLPDTQNADGSVTTNPQTQEAKVLAARAPQFLGRSG